MGSFTPLLGKEPVALPVQDPLLNLSLGEEFEVRGIPDIRRDVIGFLASTVVSTRIGHAVSRDTIDAAESCLAELLSNAERPDASHPEAGRHATGVYVWAYDGLLDVGVGDSTDGIDGDDDREQTAVLPPSDGEDVPDDDLDAILKDLRTTGLGGTEVERLADAVCHSLVSAEDAARTVEPRTHKVIRFILRVAPGSPIPDNIAA